MPYRAERAALGAALALALASCAGGGRPPPGPATRYRPVSDTPVRIGPPYKIAGVTYYPRDERGYDAVGIASWYGNESGSRTANGERFRPEGISAAHKTLPLPSYVEVTALDTGRTILVRVNDRGPFHDGRIIDLSKGAARALGVLGRPARVRVRRVDPPEADRAALRAGRLASARPDAPPQRFASAPPPPPPLPRPTAAPRPALQLDLPPPEPETAWVRPVPLPPSVTAAPAVPAAPGWFVQLGVFSDRARAESLLPPGDSAGPASIAPVAGLWRVRVGPYDEAGARAALAQLRTRGYQDAVLVRPPLTRDEGMSPQ